MQRTCGRSDVARTLVIELPGEQDVSAALVEAAHAAFTHALPDLKTYDFKAKLN